MNTNPDTLYKLYGRKLNGYKKGFIDGVKAYEEHQRKVGLDKINERINRTIIGKDRHYTESEPQVENFYWVRGNPASAYAH